MLDRARKSAAIGFAAHMQISDDYDPSLPPTWADPDQLQQVFLNLLKNAAEAGRAGGTIRLRTFYELSLKVRRRDGSGAAVPLQVEVIDDGPGIPPDIAQDLFEPFVSGARERHRPRPRAGQQDHRGSRRLDRRRFGAGGAPCSAFRFRSPPKTPRQPERPDPWTAPFSSPMTTATIRTVLTQALTRAGCKVHATSSLMTLMRWVDEGKGDLVISDVMMPDGNGLETLPQITEKRPGLPVIIISAQNTIMTAIQATEKDAYDYLPKPFDLPDLMKRAARALDQKRPRQARATHPRRGRRHGAGVGAGGSAARRAHRGDAGALPAGGPRDEHRPARADHRRKRDGKIADRAGDP